MRAQSLCALVRGAVLAAALTAALAVGCGGRAVDFPVPDNTPVADVTVTQAKQMCQQTVNAVSDEVTRAQCIAKGLQALRTGADCEQVTRDCEADPPSEFDFSTACDDVDAAAVEKLKACDVTVGEYEACVNDMIDAVRASVSSLSCSMRLEDFAKLSPPSTPSSCTKLAGRCPSLDINVPGSSDDGGSGGSTP